MCLPQHRALGDSSRSQPEFESSEVGVQCCRGGLIKWADLTGAAHVAKRLSQWAEFFKADGLSGVFEPCQYLKEAASSGRQLSAGVSSTSKL